MKLVPRLRRISPVLRSCRRSQVCKSPSRRPRRCRPLEGAHGCRSGPTSPWQPRHVTSLVAGALYYYRLPLLTFFMLFLFIITMIIFCAHTSQHTAQYTIHSAANCYKGCKWSRMRPLVLSQEPEDQSILRLFYAIFTGCRFDSGSRLRQQFWSTSVCMTWLHSTFRCIASRVTSRRLRSAHSGRLTVPRTRTNYVDRSFAVQGPRV